VKFVRFRSAERESYGIQISQDHILDVPALAQEVKQILPPSLDDLIRLGEKSLAEIAHLIDKVHEKDKNIATISLRNAKLLAPLISPPKIVCLGLNYHDHIAEQNAAVPDDLVIFMKPRTTIADPNDPIVKPAFVKKLDYEAELAIIVGKKGKDIKLEEAKHHIFGYTCLNDVSARDIQFKDKQWTRGKSFDTFAPMGPCITTTDQIGDPSNLWIRTRVNSELRQNSRTGNMVFNVYQIVRKLSQVMTLEPCDVIATGTPSGVGFAAKPEPKFLELGDVVEVEIENIGILRNCVAGAN